jgi:peptidyl-dipeptidase A
VTPSYLKEVGLYDHVPKSEAADINDLMKRALDAIAFLPFGMLVDHWRYTVFDGRTEPASYNSTWWQLRSKYQGVSAPLPRSEEDFDPGAKYHVAANVPYSRYFIARILQYQFHRALCRAAGHAGPLHECSIFGKKEAGKKLISMMQLGQSLPWPDVLEALSGERTMDATAIVDYYAPLERWLHEATKGERCGW